MPKALGASCIEPIIHTCLATANGSVTANLPQIGPSSNDKHLLTLIWVSCLAPGHNRRLELSRIWTANSSVVGKIALPSFTCITHYLSTFGKHFCGECEWRQHTKKVRTLGDKCLVLHWCECVAFVVTIYCFTENRKGQQTLTLWQNCPQFCYF